MDSLCSLKRRTDSFFNAVELRSDVLNLTGGLSYTLDAPTKPEASITYGLSDKDNSCAKMKHFNPKCNMTK